MIADALIAFVALEHLAFLVLESFLWATPFGQKLFKMTPEQASFSKPLAQNQGLYNGFLAAGLLWSLAAGPALAPSLKAFFLGCVAAAGVFGGLTASRRILLVQAAPALLALVLLFL